MRWFRRRPAAPSVPKGERIYAIGDIHGRLDLLLDLCDRISKDVKERAEAKNTLIILGDFVDRGPDAADVIALLRDWEEQSDAICVLRGNHEDIMISAWNGNLEAFRAWLSFGGRETIASFGGTIIDEDLESTARQFRKIVAGDTIRWLDKLPLSLRIGDYYFVHAGVRPGIRLALQDSDDLLWIRDEFLLDDSEHGAVIVHGHSVTDGVEVKSNRIGIDTGAYRTGRLTALGLEGSQRWVLATGGEEPAQA